MIALRLLRIEWFKASRRLAFWLTVGVPFGLFAVLLTISQSEHASHPERASGFSLPRDWLDMLQGMPSLSMMLALTLVALLVASERTWRTQRQNVIDGLSRGQFFSAKLLLSLLVAVIFWAMPIVLGLVFAIFDGNPGYSDGTGPFLPALVLQSFGGFLVYLLVIVTMGLLFAIVASSSGAALALALVFMAGQLPLVAWALPRGGTWAEIAIRSPSWVLQVLPRPTTYMARPPAQPGVPVPPDIPALSGLEANLWGLLYCGIFVTIAWLAFRRRDL